MDQSIWMGQFMKKNYLNGQLKYTDFVIKANGKEIPCHKLVLAAHSSVFEKMLDMGDTKEATKGHLEISDFSTEAVEVMLKYMYTKENVQDEDINFDLLALADKYDLKFLLDECVPKFIKKIDLENCLEVYNFAFMHNLHRVKIGAFQFIKSNWNKVKHEKERRNNLHPKASEELIDLAMYALYEHCMLGHLKQL